MVRKDTVMFSIEDLERPRTISEVYSFVKMVLDETKKSDELTCMARVRRNKFYNKFLIEYYPLYVHLKHVKYNPGTIFKYIIGNQGYDFEVFDNNNKLIEKIEVTYPHDGKKFVTHGRQLNIQGYSDVEVGDLKKIQKEYISSIIKNISEKKSKKDYSDCSLIILIDPHMYFWLDDEAHQNKFKKDIMRKIDHMKINAKKIFVCTIPIEYCYGKGTKYLDIHFTIKE